jgi:hypothetical protein
MLISRPDIGVISLALWLPRTAKPYIARSCSVPLYLCSPSIWWFSCQSIP